MIINKNTLSRAAELLGKTPPKITINSKNITIFGEAAQSTQPARAFKPMKVTIKGTTPADPLYLEFDRLLNKESLTLEKAQEL